MYIEREKLTSVFCLNKLYLDCVARFRLIWYQIQFRLVPNDWYEKISFLKHENNSDLKNNVFDILVTFYSVNPLMPVGNYSYQFFICCPRDCVSRHNQGWQGG